MVPVLLRWLVRLFCWDGVLPALNWGLPAVLLAIFPNGRGLIEILAIAAPTIAVIVRFYVGKRTIRTNHCHPVIQDTQMVFFCLGIFLLFILDALMILSHLMPAAAVDREKQGILAMLAIYLTLMALAMFPGFSASDHFASPRDN